MYSCIMLLMYNTYKSVKLVREPRIPSHKALKNGKNVLTIIVHFDFLLFLLIFCKVCFIQVLSVHIRFKSPFCQTQNSVLKLNYAQCVILSAQSHVLFIQLSRNFASLVERIVSSRAFVGSLILIYFFIY